MTKRRTTSSRCQKPTRVISGWRDDAGPPRETTNEPEDVSLDDILESSVLLSLAELHRAHAAQMTAEVEAQVQRKEALLRRREELRLAKEAEAKTMVAEALERKRAASLDRRITEAHAEGADRARVMKRIASDERKQREATLRKKAELDLEIVRAETHQKKRTLRHLMQAAVVLSGLTAGIVGIHLAGAERSHSAELSALATEANSVANAAERRVLALEKQLNEKEQLTIEELKDLQDSLSTARTQLAKAEEEAESYNRKKHVQPQRRVATRQAPVSNDAPRNTTQQKSTSTKNSIASSNDIYDNGEKCLPHDPMCFGL